jgi:hypothetical protein
VLAGLDFKLSRCIPSDPSSRSVALEQKSDAKARATHRDTSRAATTRAESGTQRSNSSSPGFITGTPQKCHSMPRSIGRKWGPYPKLRQGETTNQQKEILDDD